MQLLGIAFILYLQKISKVTTSSNYTTSSSSLLYELGWDTLEQRRTNHLAVTMYKVINGLFSVRLRDIFQNTSQVHSHTLSSDINLFIPRPLSDAGKHSFQYRGATPWNTLRIQARNQATLTSITVLISYP